MPKLIMSNFGGCFGNRCLLNRRDSLESLLLSQGGDTAESGLDARNAKHGR